jgi:four helix bundle protein
LWSFGVTDYASLTNNSPPPQNSKLFRLWRNSRLAEGQRPGASLPLPPKWGKIQELGEKRFMGDDNTALSKSKKFAIKIVNLYKYLSQGQKEFILSKQLLRAGTSIGANLAEAECAMSKRDFLAKVYISFKECSETKYWLELLLAAEFITEEEYNNIFPDCAELQKMLSSTTKTLREQLAKTKFPLNRYRREKNDYQ